MKLNKILSLALSVACCFGVSSTFAATCNGTQGSVPAMDSPPGVSGNSCGNNLNFSGSSALCGGVSFSTTGTDAYQMTLGPTDHFTVTVSSSAFVPDVAILATNCADNSSCVNGTDYESTSGSAPFTITTGMFSGNTAGTYFLIITDSTGNGAQCGAYNLSFTGATPVKLQQFSVQ
ncbi:MAG TPA: hypothetical protein VFC24_03355 [Casimicrobiaceae bacterium]|nr:hypothetical protein [Casimicrobiaceae bacterium]